MLQFHLSPFAPHKSHLRASRRRATMSDILSGDKLCFAEEQFSSEELEILKALAEVSLTHCVS